MVGCISPQTATFLCTKHFFKSHNSNQTNVKIVFRPGLRKKYLLCATCTHFPRFQGTRPDHVQVRFALLFGNLSVFTHGTLYAVGSKIPRELGDFDKPFLVLFLRRKGRGKGNGVYSLVNVHAKVLPGF